MATRERLALTSNIKKTQILNKWPQENAWLKRAIWNTQIFNKWPQENACGSNEQYGIHKYSINGHRNTPG